MPPAERRHGTGLASNEVRIIGGKWKGRKLTFPARADLRPTLGRVRETLFNWLRADVAGSRCLDLFAGSGALGFEALSRGAAHVTFSDSDRRAVRALTDNAGRLDAGPAATIVCSRAERLLAREEGPWDIVFLDPPFRSSALEAILDQPLRNALAPDGVIYVEVPERTGLEFPGWTLVKSGRAGDTRFGLLASP